MQLMPDIKNLKLCMCFIHFDDVSQSLTQVTSQRLLKFISCRKRWIKLEGEKSDICRKSYGLFTDEDVVEDVVFRQTHASICNGFTIKTVKNEFVMKISLKRRKRKV